MFVNLDNLPYNLNEQILRLNKIVIEFSYPYILSEITSREKYINFIEQPTELVPIGSNVS